MKKKPALCTCGHPKSAHKKGKTHRRYDPPSLCDCRKYVPAPVVVHDINPRFSAKSALEALSRRVAILEQAQMAYDGNQKQLLAELYRYRQDGVSIMKDLLLLKNSVMGVSVTWMPDGA